MTILDTEHCTRLRSVVAELKSQAEASRVTGAALRGTIYISPPFDEDLQPLEVTIGFVGEDEDGPEMTATIQPELWNAITAMWEHNAESAAYAYGAQAITEEFPEVKS